MSCTQRCHSHFISNAWRHGQMYSTLPLRSRVCFWQVETLWRALVFLYSCPLGWSPCLPVWNKKYHSKSKNESQGISSPVTNHCHSHFISNAWPNVFNLTSEEQSLFLTSWDILKRPCVPVFVSFRLESMCPRFCLDELNENGFLNLSCVPSLSLSKVWL